MTFETFVEYPYSSFSDLSKVSKWLRENVGEYNVSWTFDGTHIVENPVVIYFSKEQDASFFTLSFL